MTKKAEIFKVLGDEDRLRIINLLLSKDSLCVCEMVHALNIPQYSLSRHLMLLKSIELVDVKKEGKWRYHYLVKNSQTNRALFEFLRNYLNDDASRKERNALGLRLLLREGGKCVIGFVPEKKLLRLIKQKRHPKHSKSLS
jgi:ArsR family transcriptional regulator